MATVVSIMDRDGWNAQTDVIVVVEPPAKRLQWVPRDLWCAEIRDRVNTAFARGGHPSLTDALAEHGIMVEHGICLRRAATKRALEGVTVEVPVPGLLRFEYPEDGAEVVEDGSEVITFSPPAETLSGDRIHQWLGARYAVDGSTDDRDRIARQQAFLASLLRQGYSFDRAIAEPDLVDVSDPAAIDEVRLVDASWSLVTLGNLCATTIDGKEVLVERSAPRPDPSPAGGAVPSHRVEAEWRPTPNFERGRAGERPRGIVLHSAEGSFWAAASWFARPESGVSAHYLVGLDGRVAQFVDEQDTARHAGRVRDPTAELAAEGNPNLYTIGIEFEDRGDPNGVERTEDQYRVGARLIGEVASRWRIPLDRRHVIGHREVFAAKDCPGNLDIDRLVSAATTSPSLVCMLPVRNAARDLPGYLESVRYLGAAVVALDDGSTDETRELLAESAEVDLLLCNPAREGYGGWSDAANRERLLASAGELDPDWVLFLDADERLDPEDAVALREFIAADAIPGCAYGLELHRRWENGKSLAGFTWVYRLFAYAPGQSLPPRRLHFNPVPREIPRRAWVRTTIRISHLDSPERLEERRNKYREIDPDRALERRPMRLLGEPAARELREWARRDPSLPVLDPARTLASPAPSDTAADGRPALRPAARKRLVCMLPVREAEADIPGYLESASQFADAIVALDDGSTDRTGELLEESGLVETVIRNPPREDYLGWDERRDRARLLSAAGELAPEWVIYLDADERIEPGDAAALRGFVERGAEYGCAYGFRVFRMINDLERYDRAGLWVYRMFAWEPGQELIPQQFHGVPVPTSIPRERWVNTTVRIQHLSSLTEERRLRRYRKWEQVDPDRVYQADYSHLLEVGTLKRWRRRPAGLPVLADPLESGTSAELDLESLDFDAPLLSAIVIARNDEQRIERAVRSVVEQNCAQPFEVIVVVSGEDRTAEIVRTRFPGVKLIELDGEVLPGRARNAGVAHATGDYVSFPGSHVELPQGSLAARIEAHGLGHAMVTGSVLNGTMTRAGWASYFLDHSAALPGRPSGQLLGPPDHCSYVRDFVLEVGGFPGNLRAGEDTVVNRKLARLGRRAYRAQDVRLVHHSPCTSPWELALHHFRRGRAWGRILIGDHLGEGRLLSRSRLASLLFRYVPARLARTSVSVRRWGEGVLPEYRRVRILIAVGALAAWTGLWYELLRPGPGKLGILFADQREERDGAEAT